MTQLLTLRDDYWTWTPWGEVQPQLDGLDAFGDFTVVE